MKSRYGLEIRAATSADAPGLSELLATAGHNVPARVLADRLDALRQTSAAALIAAEWGPPSGLIVLHWYQTLDADHPVAQITTLLVAPDDRRRGIGRLLIKAASQTARVAGCGALSMLATPDQPAMAEFQRATGFTDAGSHVARALRKKG